MRWHITVRFVEESRAEAGLEAPGIVGPIRDLALGRATHPILSVRVRRPNLGGVNAPPGQDVVPLWEFGTLVTGARAAHSPEREFIIFDLEDPEDVDVDVVAFSEQGPLADLFLDLHEDGRTRAELGDAARALGFLRLDDMLDFYEKELAQRTVDYNSVRRTFTRGITD